MNDLIQMFKTRRSCKAYTDQKVEESVLDAILEAGTYAPTGMGRQSPLIVCVQDQETRDKISQLNAAIMKTDIDPFFLSSIVVVVFGDTRVPTYRDDANLVMGNLLNAAHAVGVDSCYIYRAREVFQTPEGQELMKQWGIDPAYEGIGNVILGYGKPEGIKPAAKRKADYIRKI